TANVMIILLVASSRYIRFPMYFFLSHLSCSDLILTTTIVPELLHVIGREGSTIPFYGCFAQFYFFCLSGMSECLLLAVMSYDRYLAICNPLRYSSIMDMKLCVYLVIPPWTFGILLASPHIILLNQLSFCDSNIIHHFFCDLVPLLNLSCSDTSINHIVLMVMSLPFLFLPFIFITITYINITIAILRISTTTGRRKAFSTCSSHLTVVCLYYGTLIINYLVPSNKEYLGLQNLVSVLFTIVTPLLNPISYGLRNEQIRGALI
ncbi:olfactory receptor 11L1-like, partial [Pelobates cultripes]